MKKKYQSKILQAIHEDMEGLHKLGIVTDTEMQEFDKDCLIQKPVKNNMISSSTGSTQSILISAKSANL